MTTRPDLDTSDATNQTIPASPLLIFDGHCGLCSRLVRFIVWADKAQVFHFATAQSRFGRRLYRRYGLDPDEMATNLLLIDGHVFTKFAGAIEALVQLGWPWRAFAFLRWTPKRLGDWLYDRVARNRYRLFGPSAHCDLPTLELKNLFHD